MTASGSARSILHILNLFIGSSKVSERMTSLLFPYPKDFYDRLNIVYLYILHITNRVMTLLTRYTGPSEF